MSSIGIEIVLAVDKGLTNTFLIDVVKQQIKRVHDGEKALLDSRWWEYQEIQSSGKKGNDFSIVWMDGKPTRTRKVVDCTFLKVG